MIPARALIRAARPAQARFGSTAAAGAGRSSFGPKYKTQPNLNGMSLDDIKPTATLAAGMGAATGIFALFFFADVPRVRKDVMEKVPFLKPFFEVVVAPEDNPF